MLHGKFIDSDEKSEFKRFNIYVQMRTRIIFSYSPFRYDTFSDSEGQNSFFRIIILISFISLYT
jgi:hypothetical protein